MAPQTAPRTSAAKALPKAVPTTSQGIREPVQRFTVLIGRPDEPGNVGYFRVPLDVMAAFAPRLRVPVVVTIKGYSYRTTIAPYGGEFYVPVRKEVREQSRIDVGDTVQVAMERDTGPRTVDVPADFARALKAAGVRDAFDAMSFTSRKELVVCIVDAKRPETRARRLAKAVAEVKAARAKAREKGKARK